MFKKLDGLKYYPVKAVKNLPYLCILLGLLFGSANTFAANVSLITWNTFLLDTPDIFGIGGREKCEGNDCRQRAREVAHKVNYENVDIANLQEVFETIAYEELNSAFLTYGYNYRVWDKESGLYTASRFPILNSYFEEYIWEHGFAGDGWDVHKDKGFLVMELAIPNRGTIKVVNTHLDAGNNDCEDKTVRMLQAYQLKAYIENYVGSNPTIIGGDFNINARSNAALGSCSSNERDALENTYGFNPGDDSKSQFTLLKQILNYDAVHELLGMSLSSTKVGSNGAIDYFLANNYQGAITFQDMQILDQIWQRNFCYSVPVFDGGIISDQRRTECFNHILSESELDQLSPFGAEVVIREADQVREAQSDHFPVRLSLIVH